MLRSEEYSTATVTSACDFEGFEDRATGVEEFASSAKEKDAAVEIRGGRGAGRQPRRQGLRACRRRRGREVPQTSPQAPANTRRRVQTFTRRLEGHGGRSARIAGPEDGPEYSRNTRIRNTAEGGGRNATDAAVQSIRARRPFVRVRRFERSIRMHCIALR